ncbi:MAG: hypothetical protein L0170_11705 [Acidobacteria bacterium]|nr:hypothetical protein [Acidobacteriota bacterium]
MRTTGKPMVPEIILKQLARVRRREKTLRLAWGLGRAIALSGTGLFVACLIDWLIDLRTDTPWALRAFLLAAQVVFGGLALAVLVVRPLRQTLSDRDLALWVEARFPAFGHRLITTIELNCPEARTEGMSGELLEAVSRQARELTSRTDLQSRFDLGRLNRGMAMVAGVVIVAAFWFAVAPHTTSALLSRQWLSARPIPRSVEVEPELSRRVWPSGEEVRLRFRTTGKVRFETLSGMVRIEPRGRPAEEYPLVLESADGAGGAIFSAVIPPTTIGFVVRGWLGDGRTRKPASIEYEPRPVVQKVDGWVLLPKHCGLRPDGTPYEQYRVRGEIAGPQGSFARLLIEVQKPVTKGIIELLGRAGGESASESVLRRVPIVVKEDGRHVEGLFELRAGETAYRVLVEDHHGFANAIPPKRGIAIVPEEPPKVHLLAERFEYSGEAHGSEDSEVDGMPIPIGGPIRLSYYCEHPYGLDHARLAYRVIKPAQANDSGAADASIPWQYLPLAEVRGTEAVGLFDLRRGRFAKSGFLDQVEFHPTPSPDPALVLGRLEGGGSFDFQTKPISGVQVGDQIELRIEVFARNPALGNTPGRSETRVKSFVTMRQFTAWVMDTLKQESRIRVLESRQRTVFTPVGDR